MPNFLVRFSRYLPDGKLETSAAIPMESETFEYVNERVSDILYGMKQSDPSCRYSITSIVGAEENRKRPGGRTIWENPVTNAD